MHSRASGKLRCVGPIIHAKDPFDSANHAANHAANNGSNRAGTLESDLSAMGHSARNALGLG